MIVLGLFEHLKCYVWYIEFYSRYDWIDKKLLPHVTYLTGQNKFVCFTSGYLQRIDFIERINSQCLGTNMVF